MPLWEYKVISSGRGGFATPALLEKFLNDLGREEWEIIEFRSLPDNALAFTGLARRSTQRDWTLEDAAAAAARAEAEKLRAEFSAKFQAATTTNAGSGEEKAASFLEEKAAPDDGFRKPVDTSRDSDPDAPEEEKDEWDDLAAEDELPSFFDALKPHMRRNQRGPGMSVGTDYLAKKWGLDEGDIKGALVECGLQIPADENAKPVYVEYDGDLYWVNINRRGEIWINTREKPRPVFRVVQATRVTPEAGDEQPAGDEKTSKSDDSGAKTEAVRHPHGGQRGRQPEMPAAPKSDEAAKPDAGPARPLPEGAELLQKIRPMMRRNRRGPGGSGSTSFLSRALRCTEADLVAKFAVLGLVLPENPNDPSPQVEIGDEVWWLNKDSRGGLWINGRGKREADKSGAPASSDTGGASSPESQPDTAGKAELTAENKSSGPAAAFSDAAPAGSESASAGSAATVAADGTVFAAIRPHLKQTRTGGFAGKLDRVAAEAGRSPEVLTASLVGSGLKLPEKSREKPVFVEHAGEIYWLNLNAKSELWVNAKASKFAHEESGDDAEGGEAGRKPARRSGRSKKPAGPAESSPERAG